MKLVSIIEKVTLPLKYKLMLVIGSGCALFAPSAWLQQYLGLQIEGAARTTLGIVFILFTSFSAAEILIKLFGALGKPVIDWVKELGHRRALLRNLRGLSRREREYLATFLDQDTITHDMPVNDGITRSLIEKQIIYVSSEISKTGVYFPCNVHRFVWNELQKHPELVHVQKGKGAQGGRKT